MESSPTYRSNNFIKPSHFFELLLSTPRPSGGNAGVQIALGILVHCRVRTNCTPQLGKWLSQPSLSGKQIAKIWLIAPQLDGREEARFMARRGAPARHHNHKTPGGFYV